MELYSQLSQSSKACSGISSMDQLTVMKHTIMKEILESRSHGMKVIASQQLYHIFYKKMEDRLIKSNYKLSVPEEVGKTEAR
jgi:hypothetical protein